LGGGFAAIPQELLAGFTAGIQAGWVAGLRQESVAGLAVNTQQIWTWNGRQMMALMAPL
jgi:hypothetical protein